jgi:23S rRNA pseudouridine1911/1915/1917 synthase
MDFTSEWPDDLTQLIEKWRGYMKGTTRDTFSTAQQ